MTGQAFKPGERVEETGIYRVNHKGHRPEHEVTLVEKEEFPLCVRCGEEVRFWLERAAHAIQHDHDFKPPQQRRRKTVGRH